MFVKSHPSQDITCEGILKSHRLNWQAVADLAFRAHRWFPRIPLKPRLLGTFQASEVSRVPGKVARECIKVVLRMSRRCKVGCSLTCVIKKFVFFFRGKHVLKLLVLVIGFLFTMLLIYTF
jgi:hypothetical protein